MGVGEKSSEKKLAKNLKKELGQFRKQLCGAGVEKNEALKYLKELQAALNGARRFKAEYMSARGHSLRARRKMERMMDGMGDWPDEEIIKNMKELVQELDHAGHDCLLREDDNDFTSSRNCLDKMAKEGVESSSAKFIMLRSELENLYAILSEALEWQEPVYFDYAYYFLNENGEALKEKGNDARASFVADYRKEHFDIPFFGACRRAGIEEEVRQAMRDYMAG